MARGAEREDKKALKEDGIVLLRDNSKTGKHSGNSAGSKVFGRVKFDTQSQVGLKETEALLRTNKNLLFQEKYKARLRT